MLALSLPSFAQSWESALKKSEKLYIKGKYHKVPKATEKFREKTIPKKHPGNLGLVSLSYIMEAKSFQARVMFAEMETNLTLGLALVDSLSGDSTAYYTYMAYLRSADIYNDYGNYKKVDSLLTWLKSKKREHLPENLKVQLQIRSAINDVRLGRYEEVADIPKLISTWKTLLEAPFQSDKPISAQIKYREGLLLKLYTADLERLADIGEYEKAFDQVKNNKRTINRLTSTQSQEYVLYEIAVAKAHLDYGDTDEAYKLANQMVTFSPKVTTMWPSVNVALHAALASEQISKASALTDKLTKAYNKAHANRKYINVLKQYYQATIEASQAEEGKNPALQFNSLLASAHIPPDHKLRTDILKEGIDYTLATQRSENFKLMEKFFLELEPSLLARYGKESLPYPVHRAKLAGYYLEFSENPSKAFAILTKKPYEKPLSMLRPSHPDYAKIVNSLGEYFTLIGDYDYAIELTQQVISALKQNPHTSNTYLGEWTSKLARTQVLGGYYKQAEENTDDALKLIRRNGDKKSEEYVQALNDAAALYATMGLYGKAERLINKSRSIYKKLPTVNQELRLKSIVDLAALYTRMGEYSETEELLNEVLEERTRLYGKESRHLIAPHAALGEMFRIRGQYPEAEKNLRKALSITKATIGDTTLLFAENLSKLVKLYLDLGNYEAALVNATDVLKVRERTLRKGHILFADTYQDLGHVHKNLNSDFQVVEGYYLKMQDIVQENFGKGHPLYAEALVNVANVHIHQGQYQKALELLEQADDIWEGSLDEINVNSGKVARLKGDIYSQIGEHRKAKKEYAKASKYFEQLFSEEHPEYINTLSRLARAYYIEGQVTHVEDVLSKTTDSYLAYTKTYFPTLSEDEKAKFWNKIKPDFEFYNTVAVAYKERKPKYLENMYDFAMATKGLLLNNSIKTRNSILHSGDSSLIRLFQKWVEKKEYLTTILSQSEEQLQENEVDAKTLKEEIQLLEKELSATSSDFQNGFEGKLYAWKDVRDALRNDEAAIEMIRYREFDSTFNEDKIRYAALIVTSNTKRNPTLILLPDGSDMEGRHFQYLRNATKYKLKDLRSFDVYLKPIYEEIKDKKVVYFSPDGVYNQINVEALRMSDQRFVIDAINIRTVNNTKTLAMSRKKESATTRKPEMTALLLGNPVYYSNKDNEERAKEQNNKVAYVPPLPGTEKEVKNIINLLQEHGWKIESYLGTNATENQIKQAQNYTLIHIATHGFFDDAKKADKTPALLMENDDNPLERSGLLAEGGGDVLVKASKNYNIEDGVLTAYEAMNLNFDQTELIVLSACETGRGEVQQGEGVFGLQRSFLVAGADAIIMSLFQVSDEVTQKLMVEFYKNWLSGQDKRTAFNNAQRTIKKTYEDPIYWGAFTMIANG